MFTGIIEETGTVAEIIPSPQSIRLLLEARVTADDSRIGDSLAVNGCCLTIVEKRPLPNGALLAFDLLNETWTRTNFQHARVGSLLNLERPLLVNGRIHGHFVTGHADGMGRIEAWEPRGSDWFLRVAVPPEIGRYSIFKGSIALDGISLTVADCSETHIAVWIIPHTRQVTSLQQYKAGAYINVEVDLLAKYAEKFTSQLTVQRPTAGKEQVLPA